MNKSRAQISQDLGALIKRFPNFDRVVVEEVYRSCGQDYHTAAANLSSMNTPAPVHISPAQKLSFLRAIFDKLNPQFIEDTLRHWNWSVEGSLDTLLDIEKQRSDAEEEARRREEAEMYRRWAEEQARVMREREEIERRNVVAALRCAFPLLPEYLVDQEASARGWNYQFAFQALMAADQERQRREREAFMEQERRRLEEAQRIENEQRRRMEAQIHSQSFDVLVKEVRNWDDLVQRVAPNEGDEVMLTWRVCVLDVLVEMFPQLSREELEDILQRNGWEPRTCMRLIEKAAYEKSAQKLRGVFPRISADVVDETLKFYFPDEVAAMRELQPVSSYTQQISIHDSAIHQAQQSLLDAKRKLAEYEMIVAQMLDQRNKRAAEINSYPPGKDREFFESIDSMKTQKDDAWIKENGERLKNLLVECEKNLEKLKQAEREVASQNPAEAIAKYRESFDSRRKGLNTQERVKEFEERLKEKEKERKIDPESLSTAKKTKVAEMMYNKLGEEGFSKLQEAIGRAPGGVARGYSRIDYAQKSRDSVSLLPSSSSSSAGGIPSKSLERGPTKVSAPPGFKPVEQSNTNSMPNVGQLNLGPKDGHPVGKDVTKSQPPQRPGQPLPTLGQPALNKGTSSPSAPNTCQPSPGQAPIASPSPAIVQPQLLPGPSIVKPTPLGQPVSASVPMGGQPMGPPMGQSLSMGQAMGGHAMGGMGQSVPMSGPAIPMGGQPMPMGGPIMPMGGSMPMGGPPMPMGGQPMGGQQMLMSGPMGGQPMGGPPMPMGGSMPMSGQPMMGGGLIDPASFYGQAPSPMQSMGSMGPGMGYPNVMQPLPNMGYVPYGIPFGAPFYPSGYPQPYGMYPPPSPYPPPSANTTFYGFGPGTGGGGGEDGGKKM